MRPGSRQAGFSFIELAFVITVLGLIAGLLAQVVPALRRASADARSVRNLAEVENALLAFASVQGRLPCTDTDGDGVEDAAACVAVGGVPYATLGFSAPLVNADGYPFKYGVFLNPGTSLRDKAALASNTERYRPSIGSGADVALTDKAFGASNRRLDFCQGLRAGMSLGFNPSYLHIETGSGARKHVAYVLVDPGVGNMDLTGDMFDGLNGTASAASPKFEPPNRGQSLFYDDRVVLAHFDQMWEQLGCSANMATAGRALPNVETTLALFKQSLTDYRVQLDIAKDMAFADNFSAGAGIAGATAGLASSAAAMATDIASAINTAGATAPAAVSAGIAIGLNAAALGVAIANQVFTVQTYNDFVDELSNFDSMISTKFDPLQTDVQLNVQTGGTRVYSNQ